MVFFHCDLCNHDCKSMQTFNKHISSKKHKDNVDNIYKNNILANEIFKPTIHDNIIVTPTKYMCQYCNKEYVRQKKYISHQTKCGQLTHNTPLNINKSHQQSGGSQYITNITNNNICLTQTNNNYFVMPFGKEDLSMLTDDMRKYIISRGFSAYAVLLDELYKYPQNNNVHFYDKRNRLVKYIDSNNNVKITKFKDAIEDIVYTNFDRIDEFLEEHMDSLDEKEKKYAKKLLDAHTNEMKKKEKLKEYNIISECKINEIAPRCKKNFDKLNQLLESNTEQNYSINK